MKKLVSIIILIVLLSIPFASVFAATPQMDASYEGNPLESGSSVNYTGTSATVGFSTDAGTTSFSVYTTENGLIGTINGTSGDITFSGSPSGPKHVYIISNLGTTSSIILNFYVYVPITPGATYSYATLKVIVNSLNGDPVSPVALDYSGSVNQDQIQLLFDDVKYQIKYVCECHRILTKDNIIESIK